MNAGEYFYEIQRFRQWWLWGLTLITTAGILVFNAVAVYRQLILGEPYGDTPMSDGTLTIVVILSTAFIVFFVTMMYTAKLETRVEKHGLSFRYYPFVPHWRFIPKDEISRWEIRRYFSGGYGVRVGFRFTTYNVSGFTGLELIRNNRRNIRIGTRRGEELRMAMKKLFNPE